MSAWAKQQTKETFRANQELASSIFNVSAEQAEKNRNEYKAMKLTIIYFLSLDFISFNSC